MFGKIEGENHSLISTDEKIEYKLLRISQLQLEYCDGDNDIKPRSFYTLFGICEVAAINDTFVFIS